jgi:acetyl esterase
MLHPQVSALLASMAAAGYADLSALTLDALRGAAREAYVPAGPPVYVREVQIPGPHGPLTARAYAPGSSQTASLLPGLVFFSAGFYVVGELAGHAALCQQLAVAADCVVVSVAVRLAPEHRFPAAADDAYAATCWIHENADELGIDHRRIAIGGESTGATLATSVCRLAKERRNPPLSFQLLLYPVTDLRAAAVERASEHDAQLVTSAVLTKVIELYLSSDAERSDPRCSPSAAGNLIGLPPALIINAEDDALSGQVAAYAHMLEQAQVPVTLSRYAGVGHGFVHMFAFVDRGREALAECAAALRTALQPPFETETAS